MIGELHGHRVPSTIFVLWISKKILYGGDDIDLNLSYASRIGQINKKEDRNLKHREW